MLTIVQVLLPESIYTSNAWLKQYCIVVFALSSGPLVWAIIAWKNRLVFHDIDKVTSLAIHSFPVGVSYLWRWTPMSQPADAISELLGLGWSPVKFPVPPSADTVGLWELYALPLLVYSIWQILYYWKTEVLDLSRLNADPELQTSLRWLVRDTRNAMNVMVRRVLTATGFLRRDEALNAAHLKTKIIFMVAQLIYTFLTLLPVWLMYNNFYFHTCFLLGVFSISTYNGAEFYIQNFSEKYQQQINSKTQSKSNSQGARGFFSSETG